MTSRSSDYALCFHRSLRCSASQIRRLYDQALVSCGLRGYEYGLLALIADTPSIGIVELADAFLYDRATLRYRLAPLEKAGLIVMVKDARDRRARRVELTEAGSRKLAEASRLWRLAQERFESLLGREQAEALRAAADRVASPTFADAFLARGAAS